MSAMAARFASIRGSRWGRTLVWGGAPRWEGTAVVGGEGHGVGDRAAGVVKELPGQGGGCYGGEQGRGAASREGTRWHTRWRGAGRR